MNTFRTLSESQYFISFSLLLLLVMTFPSVCHAEAGNVNTAHHSNHVASNDSHALEPGHTDENPDHCCNELTTQVKLLSPALISTAVQDALFDIDESPAGLESLIVSTPDTVRVSDWQDFHFRPPGLPVYLHTQRLRI